MPASPYFLIAQVSLVAISAVAMKVGWSTQSPVKKPTKAPTTQSATAAKASTTASPTPTAAPKAIPFTPGPAVADKLPAPAEASGSALSELPLAVVESSAAQPSDLPEPPLSDIPSDMAAYNIQADAATQMDLRSQTVVFTGSVHLKSKRFALVADRLTIYMDPAQSTLKKLVANGHVDVKLAAERPEEAYRGTSHEATYNPKDFSILLTGWPIIIGAGREHRAASASTKMMLYTDKPRLTTQGRASTVITGTAAGEAAKEQGKAEKKAK